jgi:hypothetical protein
MQRSSVDEPSRSGAFLVDQDRGVSRDCARVERRPRFGRNFDRLHARRSNPVTRRATLLAASAFSFMAAIAAPASSLRAELLSHFPFDGDLLDVGPAATIAEARAGEAEFGEDRAGESPGALVLDGAGGWLELTVPGGVAPHARERSTIAFWVRSDRDLVAPGAVIYAESRSGSDESFVLARSTDADDLRLSVRVTGRSGEIELETSSTIAVFDGRWHHIAWTDDSGAARLHVDGVLDGSEIVFERSPKSFDRITMGGIDVSKPELVFAGSVDDLRLFDHVLDVAELRALLPFDACPSAGDTHCASLGVEGPGGPVEPGNPVGGPGPYLLIATASDGTGDEIAYTFTARSDDGTEFRIGPTFENIVEVDLVSGRWTLGAEVDDDALCADTAEAALCERTITVGECPTIGDTHCGGLELRGPDGGGPGRYILEAFGAVDDSGDTILYTFEAESRDGRRWRQGPQTDPIIEIELGEDGWRFLVVVDDDVECPDEADDARCEVDTSVVCPPSGDTHCDGLVITAPREGVSSPGVWELRVESATDDSGDVVVYHFQATSEGGPVLSQGSLATISTRLVLTEGVWDIAVRVDDDPSCADRALDDTCEAQIAVAAAPPGLLAHWPLDGSFESVVGAPGTTDFFDDVTAPAFTADRAGEADSAWLLDGELDGIVITEIPDLPLYAHRSLTLSFWVRGEAAATGSIWSESASRASNGGLVAIGADPFERSGRLAVELRDPKGVMIVDRRRSDGIVLDGSWHHVAWVDDAGDAALYIDGLRDGSDFSYGRPPLLLDTTTFGCRLQGDPSDCFRGELDDVLAYAGALDEAAIRELASMRPDAVFHRGDVNDDGTLVLTDALVILGYLFLGADEPPCRDAADINDDAALGIADPIALLAYLFLGAPPPPDPGPVTRACGPDGPLSPSLGCRRYTSCVAE